MRKSLVLALSICLMPLAALAQPNWGLRSGVGLEKKIAKGLDAGVDFKYYQTDNFRNTDRWSIGLSLDKRLYRNKAKTFTVKAALGYKYMNVYHSWSTKYKDDAEGVENRLEPIFYIKNTFDFNVKNGYVDTRHRATASLQAAVELGRFKISLREAYQFTHTDSAIYAVDKYRHDDGKTIWEDKGYRYEPKIKADIKYYVKNDNSVKAASDKSVLRSKINIDYDIPNWKYDPFISYELFNNLGKGLKTEKSRINVGIEFSLNKKHNFEVSYLWQNNHDDDEPAGSFVCLGYKFEL